MNNKQNITLNLTMLKQSSCDESAQRQLSNQLTIKNDFITHVTHFSDTNTKCSYVSILTIFEVTNSATLFYHVPPSPANCTYAFISFIEYCRALWIVLTHVRTH
jgi:hypothetical protein